MIVNVVMIFAYVILLILHILTCKKAADLKAINKALGAEYAKMINENRQLKSKILNLTSNNRAVDLKQKYR